MVELRIVIEGGVLDHKNIAAATFNNSEKLREAFHKLISKLFNPEKINLVIENGSGVNQCAKVFKNYAKTNPGTSLLIDLDKEEKYKLQKLNDLDLQEYQERVFFMVQSMEAWILSQPDIIIKCLNNGSINEMLEKKIVEENNELKYPSKIIHPDRFLGALLGRYFTELKGNIEKKKKYGKLKDAHLFIANLDAIRLKSSFTDFNNLTKHLQVLCQQTE